MHLVDTLQLHTAAAAPPRSTLLPLPPPPLLPPQDILSAQRACRKLLNVLLSFAYLADAPDTHPVPRHLVLLPMPLEVGGGDGGGGL